MRRWLAGFFISLVAHRAWVSRCWSHPARLRAAPEETEIRACFLGQGSFSIEDLAGYQGPKPQQHGASREELGEAAAWIRQRSSQLRRECSDARGPYIDVGELGFEAAMARRQLLGPA
jgi:hypothetical protein